ncbi:MAG: response regulator [Archangium sp.]|nr:response regulator [Archangium sp.]
MSLPDVVDRLPVIVFETRLPVNLVEMSSYWTELTGQKVEDALGNGWMAHLDPNSVSKAFTEMQGAMSRGEDITYVVRCRRKDGEWCWLRVVARPRMEAGVPLGLSGVGLVVPGPVEEGAGVRGNELERLQLSSDALLAASQDLLFHVSGSGHYLAWRAGDASRLYTSPDRFLGHSFEEVLPEHVARLCRGGLERANASGQPQTVTYDLQIPDAGLLHFEGRFVPLKGGDLILHVRDVTQVRRNEQELVAAREEALERSRLKTQFLANVSHEIRTPLTGILGVTQLLKQHQLPEDLVEYVDVLQNAGESLLAIVNDVLDLSKIEANRLELEPRVFDLEQLVVETSRMFAAQAEKKGLELMTDVSVSAKGPVRGDAARIRQILLNLLGNALKFTDEGSVRVSLRRSGERVKLLVKDTGPGIANENHVRIFEAFEQGDVGVQRRYGGTGLGLAITRRIARLMGGDVTLHSVVGEGSEFELEVPLPSVVIPQLKPTASRVTPPPRSLRVLLAEDDTVNASMTAALLSKLGHQVKVVTNGRECVDALQGSEVGLPPGVVAPRTFDLILMDVHMPELDGLEATRVIRQSERGSQRHMPIVALTANAMKGDDLRCLSAGMDAYLPKPVTVAALKDLLIWFGSQE